MRRVVAALLLAASTGIAIAQYTTSPAPRAFEPVGPVPGPARHQPPQNPLRQDPQAGLEGRRLFLHFNCAGCHGDHGGGGMGPSLRDADWIYGGEDGDIYDSIAEGRAHGMPAWGVMLPDRQIWQLVAYITTLETPKEIEPPR